MRFLRYSKTEKLPNGEPLGSLVRKMGLEPTRHGHTHLKRACLPIPALPQMLRWMTAYIILPQQREKVNLFLENHLAAKPMQICEDYLHKRKF